MIYILDTNVISAARRVDRNPSVVEWLDRQADTDLYISVITVGEIERGIVLQKQINPDFAADLSRWLDRTVTIFADRILPFTSDDALEWGQLSARIGHPGADLMIAAQALTRDAHVVTRNVGDFEPTGARILNPF